MGPAFFLVSGENSNGDDGDHGQEAHGVEAECPLVAAEADVERSGNMSRAKFRRGSHVECDTPMLADFEHLRRRHRRGLRQPAEGLSAGPVPSRIFDMPIEQLELSQRTYNCLKRSQITKVGQILQMSENELLSLRNFGQKSLVELREKLQEHGVLPEGATESAGGTIGSSLTEDSLNGAAVGSAAGADEDEE